MITYTAEPLSEVLEELKPLFPLHYEEVAMYTDKIDLNPAYDKYLMLGEFVQAYIVRDEGEVIGYTIYFVTPNLHYSDHTYAANDIIFIAPEHRHGTVAVELMQFAEQNLKDLGVSVMTMHMKNYAPFKTLMQFQQFDEAETLYTKYIWM
jgi:GNAT superfamily N-acetyltransferase